MSANKHCNLLFPREAKTTSGRSIIQLDIQTIKLNLKAPQNFKKDLLWRLKGLKTIKATGVARLSKTTTSPSRLPRYLKYIVITEGTTKTAPRGSPQA